MERTRNGQQLWIINFDEITIYVTKKYLKNGSTFVSFG